MRGGKVLMKSSEVLKIRALFCDIDDLRRS